MEQMLDQLVKLRGVGGCMLVSPEGLPMASHLRTDQDEDSFAALVAELVTRSQGLAERTAIGTPQMLHVNFAAGAVAIMAAGPSYLAVIVDPNANLALLQLELKPFVEAITKRLAI
ncbi:MAG: roadblock/LC7 domain-containing protein [Planctomycetota bacterium]|jgi:predicted regulator of Ras-like GTPase activity (Roadblock/LC7/MglB family)|nr:roadblock/LC7 domain-containing protein [Planctomycetota bacterium]